MPVKTPEMIWGAALMLGEDVHANQKRPMGRITEPIIIGGSRASGRTNLPEASRRGLNRMRVSTAMYIQQRKIPRPMERNVRDAVVTAQPRTRANE